LKLEIHQGDLFFDEDEDEDNEEELNEE